MEGVGDIESDEIQHSRVFKIYRLRLGMGEWPGTMYL